MKLILHRTHNLIFIFFFLFRYLKVASTTLRIISDSGNHSLLYTVVSSRYCRRFLIVLLSFRMDFMLHSMRFSVYFLHSKIMWSTVSSTLHNSQVGGSFLWRCQWVSFVCPIMILEVMTWSYPGRMQVMLFLKKSFLTIF